MPTTINNTLPLNWDSSVSYSKGDTVSYVGIIYVSITNGNLNHNPKTDVDNTYWKPLDIYIKDLTVMPHGDYSGDENFWERDNIYIDSNGWVYVNNEVTGINVKGRDASTVTFESLTPEQREQLRGPRGYQGERGPAGPTGPEGPMGEVVLTSEQVAALTGPRGESTYQTWLDQGHTGTPDDFLDWVRTSLTQFDKKLLSNSTNAVENQAIYNALFAYQVYLNAEVTELSRRIQVLENQLKATYNQEDIPFQFGITENGNYGYVKEGQTIPFDYVEQGVEQSGLILPSPVIMTTQFAHQDQVTSQIINNSIFPSETDFQPASLQGSVAEGNDNNDDNNVVYGSNVQVLSFDDYADTYYYIYSDGTLRENLTEGNGLYHMTQAQNFLINANTEAIEGIILPTTVNNYVSQIKFTVSPVIQGVTVNYQVGFGDNTSNLPSVVTGTGRYSGYQQGSFDDETVITLSIPVDRQNTKIYFATTSQANYIIKEIKIC